ncbi:hypothetical protein SU69_09140 [Thermosipho melanesiensis]|uniref:Heavy-metal chelation domain-containing protein n=2 Tax=Thermosipho melanesiensis TaxID=46541 RepID=A6LNZ4_THEM4|nr:DUF364 domain-containing protein [Thermosipho melanesiensis]ABR31645.1 protein of unknown function DUF364 [Thermosipho melanesiensis BI429]APT74674.1 hypothetical protein BW47_09520 [Thermosipho melanesiensis]OOC35171.1 hypothetical protein SU69_09140 [Thermosipho melanesiensis]OOC35381.1 hypothetical protein SU70_09150 [Thermosipho melanesiensis]OOC36632.1 hypothetical protein SU68_09210 [Thermosipho melanesiensis]
MRISEKLYKKALEYIDNEIYLEDYIIGYGLTSAVLSDNSCGVSYTLREDTLGKCEEFFKCTSSSGNPTSKINVGMKVNEILKIGLFSSDPFTRSVGYATLNAILQNNMKNYEKGDIIEFLEVSFEDIVGIVGKIDPLIEYLKPIVWDVLVFDRNRNGSEEILPDWSIIELLPKCSVVIITGAAVINGTIDWILKYVNTDRIAIVGPSTPLVKDIFPVKILAGVKILDSKKLFKLIAHGAGTKKIVAEKVVEKIVLKEG